MRIMSRECSAAGFQPRVLFRVNDCDMTLAMVAAGEGISTLPRLMLPHDHPGVRIKPFAAGAPIRRITAVRVPSRFLTPATERFLAMLTSADGEIQGGALAPVRIADRTRRWSVGS